MRSKACTVPSASADVQSPTPNDSPDDDKLLVHTLLLAVAEQNIEEVARCVTNGCDVNDSPVEGCVPLLLAVKLGNIGIVELLIKHGASCGDADEHGRTLLHHAVSSGFADIARHLVEEGGAVLDQRNVAGCTPLYQAAQHGHIECARALLAMRADLEARTHTGATPLYIAADRGNAAMTELLLDAGSDASMKTELQMTPLLVAAFNGHEDVVRSLLSHKVDIEQRGPCGGTALYVAAQEGRQRVAEFLIQQGAMVDARCDGDLTPSLIAAMQGHHDLVQLLLEAKGALDVCTSKGFTLAIMAARHGQTNVLKVLVEAGGVRVLDSKTKDGLSALGAAKKGHHTEASCYIEAAMANQKQLDLCAWEASLPDILLELDPPSKKRKGKSKNKGKANHQAGLASARNPVGDLSPIPSEMCPEEEVFVDAGDSEGGSTGKVLDEASAGTSTGISDEDVGGIEGGEPIDRSEDDDLHSSSWVQIARKRFAKPVISVAPTDSPKLSSQAQPAPVTPLSAQPLSAPVTPLCATSPFGLRAVLTPWPSTPEFWPCLPPAAKCFDMSASMFNLADKTSSDANTEDIFPHNCIPSSGTMSLSDQCQSMFVAPPWVPLSAQWVQVAQSGSVIDTPGLPVF